MYEEVDARFRYVDAINGFDHYSSFSVVELRRPVVGEMHLLVWGMVTTANGPNTGMEYLLTADGVLLIKQ